MKFGRTRFCELERSLTGISPRTLSLRLRALEEEGIVRRQTYAEGEHIPETVGGDVVVEERPGALELGASRELRDAEVDSVLRYTYGKSRQEIDSAFDSLKERAQSGTLDASDWQVVNAIQKLVRVTERENPNLKDIDEAISKTFDRVFAASTGEGGAQAQREVRFSVR